MLRLSFIISIVIFMTSYTFAQQADEIIGKYHLPNDLDIEIFENDGKFFGRIIALTILRMDKQKMSTTGMNQSKMIR